MQWTGQKKPFTDVFCYRCSWKLVNIHRETSMLGSTLLKRDSNTDSCEFCEMFKNSFFIEHLKWSLLTCQCNPSFKKKRFYMCCISSQVKLSFLNWLGFQKNPSKKSTTPFRKWVLETFQSFYYSVVTKIGFYLRYLICNYSKFLIWFYGTLLDNCSQYISVVKAIYDIHSIHMFL